MRRRQWCTILICPQAVIPRPEVIVNSAPMAGAAREEGQSE